MTEASYNSLRKKLKLDPNCSILKPPVYYGNSQEINFLWGSWNKATLKSLQKMMQSLTVLLSPDKSLCLCCQICTDWKLWKITTQSDWCAPIVQAAKKKGNVCICVNWNALEKQLNMIITYYLSFILSGTNLFQAGATSGFHQIPLEKDSG